MLLLAGIAFGQSTPGTVRFPSNLDDQDSLIRAKDNSRALLTVSMTSGSAQVTVDSTTSFPATGVLLIDNEQITYTAKTSTTFTGLGRGAFSTTAASHNINTSVRGAIVAAVTNTHASAIAATQAKIGTGASTPTGGTILKGTGTGTSAWSAPSSGDLLAWLGYTPMQGGNNLSEITSASTSRTNLGLGSIATQNSTGISVTGGTLSNITCMNCTSIGSAASGGSAATGDLTFNFDSDASGGGVMRVQRGGVDKAVFNNDGTAYFAGNLGLGKSAPARQLHFSAPSDGYFATFDPETLSFGRFNMALTTATNTGSSRKNQALGIGWNVAPGGGREQAGEPAFWAFQLESHYEPTTGNDVFEWYTQVNNASGAVVARPYFSSVDKSTFAVQNILSQEQLSIKNSAQTDTLAEYTSGWYFYHSMDVRDFKVSSSGAVQLLHIPSTLPEGIESRIIRGADDTNYPFHDSAYLTSAPTYSAPDGSIIQNRGGAGGNPALYMREAGAWVGVQPRLTRYVGSATVDPPSLANGASWTTQVSISGCTVGDPVIVGFSGFTVASLGYENWQMSGRCIQTGGDVRVTITNLTGSTQDLPSGVMKVIAEAN
ncbi:MAG TPA: hypothetical protein VGB17_06985 [Pyrinomonadaceae bacterium]